MATEDSYKTPRALAAHMASLALEDIETLERMLRTLKSQMIETETKCRNGVAMGSIGTSDMTNCIAVMARAHRRMGSAATLIALGFYQEEG